jgi:pimeloyl-ACP methyl ester carboxylesterase
MTQAQLRREFEESRLLDVGRARICYRRTGQGPAVVFLHGFPLSSLTWRHVVAQLSPRFTCYALDLIGLGDSTSAKAADFSSEGQGRLFQRVLENQGISSFALVGNDTGGWIARELALLEPRRVERLVLMNTEIPGHRPPWIPLYQHLARLPGSGLAFRLMLRSRRLRRSGMAFGGCFENLGRIEGEFRDLFVTPLLSSPTRLASMSRFLMEMKFARLDCFRELHGQLCMPVAFLWASADPTFPEPLAREMASQFPNVVRFDSIPRGKLFVQEEYGGDVAQLLSEFLAPGTPAS